MKGGSKVIVEPHRHEGVFIAKGKEDALVTKNLVPGVAVYGEKRISVQVKKKLYFSLIKQVITGIGLHNVQKIGFFLVGIDLICNLSLFKMLSLLCLWSAPFTKVS